MQSATGEIFEAQPCGNRAGHGSEEHNKIEESTGQDMEDDELSRHAFHSTWEEIYQRELTNARTRKAYRSSFGQGNEHKRECNSRSSSRSSSRCSSRRSSDSSSVDGEEWFGPECAKIATWVLNTLKCSKGNQLQPFFRRVHALRRADTNETDACASGKCDWCQGTGPRISQEFTKLPVLDLGCGGGQFLARLRRCGFERLAGVDYSRSAIELARCNLWGRYPKVSSDKSPHICLRQADLRDLKPEEGSEIQKGHHPCICCCEKAYELPKVSKQNGGADSEEESCGVLSCSCEPATTLPPFPVVFDKGTFDVFCLMHTPEQYVQCVHRLMPAYGLLFLTSCNCTLEELDSLFCSAPESKMPHRDTAEVPLKPTKSESRTSVPQEIRKGLAAEDSEHSFARGSPLFERVGFLPHRSFKFGGVEGQVVTSVLLRRL
ncbi:hypothetical protein, conserved [Eimeria necatrix]|uniref:Methyltransferase domain-containing protein n=1 Tax=Eimeria necatrix TaxID=51315 RepID=U6N1D2_9EIME|nr:hypothetical protein, conserved [Eimeria necatrix]CDJ70017.1 hypothetical protein, conserved [Eimeria necatrix]